MEYDPKFLLEIELSKEVPDRSIIDLLLMEIYPEESDPAKDMVTECLKIGGTEISDEKN